MEKISDIFGDTAFDRDSENDSLPSSTVTKSPSDEASSNFLGSPGNNNNPRGGEGNDILNGNDNSDFLNGQNGDDFLNGKGGKDFLNGGNGNDTLNGGNGDDFLNGKAGSDLLSGGSGGDFLNGGDGDDTGIGGVGNDTLIGGGGNDLLVGGGGVKLFGLTDNNTLVSFDPDRPNQATTISVKGVNGKLIGIDLRPANGLLYGVTDTNKIYIIDPISGNATSEQNISPIPFNAGFLSGVDFNPVPDLLRLVGANDQNLRVNVNTGAVQDGDTLTAGIQPDRNLAFAATDPNAGKDPNISAAAYTNSFAPSPASRRTTLYNIDSKLDVLTRQGGLNFLASDPASGPSPNTGQQFTIGSLGVNFADKVGFDIFSPVPGINIAYAVSGSTLYSINLTTGAATSLGSIGNGSFNFVGLTAVSVPESAGSGNDIINGGSGDDTLIGGTGNDFVFGDAGADSISFASPAEGIDTLTDFSVASDTILVSASGFGGGLTAGSTVTIDQFAIGTAALDASDRFIFNKQTGALFFDVDGSGASAQVQIAKLSPGLALTNQDIFVVV
jgi:Ca2+-binding RTX toxin-like protein